MSYMSLQFYNTLTGKKEEFKPIRTGEVGLYTCGPTVYNFAHIGNLRSYVFADVLRRTMEYNGYKVKQVMNITDVGHLTSDEDDGDDKMIKALKREGKPFTFEAMQEIARKYETAFKEDLRALNIELPKDMPRASEHIPEDIEIVQKLLEKGTAYRTSDGIYFDISKFPSYGTRGGFKLGDLKDGARVAVNAEKKNHRDFSLWKFSLRQDSEQASDLGWDFPPYGKGFPGWHIECSAMSRKYLGQPFDIHTGGIDHIPTHHQNEIAQSEAAYGVPLANVWMHNEFVNMGEAKMAKSGENFITLRSLVEKGFARPEFTYRYYLLGAQYRSPMQFSWDSLKSAEIAYDRLIWTLATLPLSGTLDESYVSRFQEILNDDLDTPKALALLWELVKDKTVDPANKLATVFKYDEALGLNLKNMIAEAKIATTLPASVAMLFKQREDARNSKDFKKSDELRDQIAKEGFEIMDTDSGPIIRKKL